MSLKQSAFAASEAVAVAAAHPLAQIGFVAACGLWLALRLPVDLLTLILSVLAISLTMMVLASQDRITKAEHAKLDELLRGVPGADDSVAGIERRKP